MRILFVTNHMHLPQRVGGSELTTHELCRHLHKRSIECALLAKLKRNNFIWVINRLKKMLTGMQYPADASAGYAVYRGWDPVDGLEEVTKRFQPDVVVVQAGLSFSMAEKSIQLGLKTVVYVHDIEYQEYGGRFTRHDLLSFIANSNFTAGQFEQEFGLKSVVIPPLVVPAKYKVESSREKVVFICPVERKGKELAFRLAENNSTIPFLFVESWPLSPSKKAACLARVKEAGNIEWLDPQKDMKKVYSQAKLLLVPSLWEETWGRVVTESQLSGIPTLASNRGGLPESVGDGGIVLDPEAEFEKWDEALKKFCFDEDFYNKYIEHAFTYAQRDAINPELLVSKFIDVVKK